METKFPPKWEPTTKRQTIKILGVVDGEKNGKPWTRADIDSQGTKMSWFPAPWQVAEVEKNNGRVINIWLDEKKRLMIDAEPVLNAETGAVIQPTATPKEDPVSYWVDEKKSLEDALYTAYRAIEGFIDRLTPGDTPFDDEESVALERQGLKEKFLTAEALRTLAITLHIEHKKRI